MEPSQTDVSKLNFNTPIVAQDGHLIQVSDNGIPTIIFFQTRPKETGVELDAVASVRMHNLDELRSLANAISETLDRHQNREP